MAKSRAKVEGWFSQLTEGRVEVFAKANGHKIRASGPEPFVAALVEVWEAQTGLEVRSAAWRRTPRTGPKPLKGQLDLTTMPELQSDDQGT